MWSAKFTRALNCDKQGISWSFLSLSFRMESSIVYDISEKLRYKFKKHPFVYLLDDHLGMLSQVLLNVLHIEDIRSYIHWKFESISDNEIHHELSKVCNGDLSLKSEYTDLEELNLVKYMFYTKFDNHE